MGSSALVGLVGRSRWAVHIAMAKARAAPVPRSTATDSAGGSRDQSVGSRSPAKIQSHSGKSLRAGLVHLPRLTQCVQSAFTGFSHAESRSCNTRCAGMLSSRMPICLSSSRSRPSSRCGHAPLAAGMAPAASAALYLTRNPDGRVSPAAESRCDAIGTPNCVRRGRCTNPARRLLARMRLNLRWASVSPD